jgi:NADH dehydrogenase
VHVSITNPAEDSALEYFSGKAHLEKALQASGLSHAILRPTVLFGREDILINNIAWALRSLPLFMIFCDGKYRLQPIHVDDLAYLAVTAGGREENTIINAIGPETFSYEELVAAVGKAIGHPRKLWHASPGAGFCAGKIIGWLMRDTFITREEIQGLMEERLYVTTPPTGTTRLSAWMERNAATLGLRYASELNRRRDRQTAYFRE